MIGISKNTAPREDVIPVKDVIPMNKTGPSAGSECWSLLGTRA
jgi:hypothetical protein